MPGLQSLQIRLLDPRSLCRNVSLALILVRMVSIFIKPVKDGHLNKETCVSFLSHSVCLWMGVIFHSDTSPSGRVCLKCIPGLIGRTATYCVNQWGSSNLKSK